LAAGAFRRAQGAAPETRRPAFQGRNFKVHPAPLKGKHVKGSLRRNCASALAIGIAIFFVSYALAAVMNIQGVTFLGGGEAEVTSPNVTGVSWIIERQGNRWMVAGVSLRFDSDLPSGSTIYVELIDSGGNAIASGSLTLTSDLPSGQPVSVSTSPSVRSQEIAKVAVSVAGP